MRMGNGCADLRLTTKALQRFVGEGFVEHLQGVVGGCVCGGRCRTSRVNSRASSLSELSGQMPIANTSWLIEPLNSVRGSLGCGSSERVESRLHGRKPMAKEFAEC